MGSEAIGPSLQMPASKELVAIEATAVIRTRYGVARNAASDPQRTCRADMVAGWALLEGEDTLPIILHIDDDPFIH